MVQTDLVGEYVTIPDEGDAGWIRAVFVASGALYVLVQRHNPSQDLKVYYALNIVVQKRGVK